MNQKRIKWVPVSIGLILFWPFGILYLLYSLKKDQRDNLRNAKMIRRVSYVLFAFAFISYTSETKSTATSDGSLLFLVGGIVLFALAFTLRAKDIRYKKYTELIKNNAITSLNDIASMTNTRFETVHKDLTNMIAFSYLKQVKIDEVNQRIVHFQQTNTNTHSVSCDSCGARNTLVVGIDATCEYCGSLLLEKK